MASPTLLDIAVANGSDALAGLIEEATKTFPAATGRVQLLGQEIQIPNVGYSRPIPGMN